jgi:hypothetical protein
MNSPHANDRLVIIDANHHCTLIGGIGQDARCFSRSAFQPKIFTELGE